MGRIKSTKKYQQTMYPTDMEGNEITLNNTTIPKFSYTKKEEVIPVKSSVDEITEFVNEDIEKLQREVAKKLGYKLVDHRLELYGSKIKK